MHIEGLTLPVVAAPMFLISGPDLVVATCRAGVVGSFPAPNCRTTVELEQWLCEIKDRLELAHAAGEEPAPWALNLTTHTSNSRLAADLELVSKYKPPIVITALGSPAPAIARVHEYGGLVVADVTTIELAEKAVKAGVDGLACVSTGAGGHTGSLSPFAFVSGVRRFFDGLIAVGGGISDGFGVAGAIAAGADLVYVGTRFLASEESMAPDPYKQMVVDCNTRDLVVSSAVTGASASWLGPSLAANNIDLSTFDRPGELNYDSATNLQGRWRDIWAAGQGVQSIDSIEASATIIARMRHEYEEAALRFRIRTLSLRDCPSATE